MISNVSMRARVCVAGVFLALALGACGGDDEPTTGSTTGSDTELDDNGFPVNAHVQPDLGVVPDGIELDGRKGTPPPEPAETDLEAAAEAAGCDLQTGLLDDGNTHISDEDAADVDYGTNPPTSGDHYGNGTEVLSGALADGAYLEPPPVGRVIHSLEHRRVAIQYSPDLSEADQLALKGVFDEDPAGVLFFPNPDMDYDVAVTAWTNLLGCDSFEGEATLDAVRAFRDTFRGADIEGTEDIPLGL